MTESKHRICIVAAVGYGRLHNRVLGKGNELIWHIPDDLKRFRKLTRGKPVVMGRKTFESIVAMRGSGLPDRPNIVITRDTDWHFDGAIVVHSLEEGMAKAREYDTDEIHIGGGADIYRQVLPLVDKLYLTLIDDDKEGDTYFPEYEKEFIAIYPVASVLRPTGSPYRRVREP